MGIAQTRSRVCAASITSAPKGDKSVTSNTCQLVLENKEESRLTVVHSTAENKRLLYRGPGLGKKININDLVVFVKTMGRG